MVNSKIIPIFAAEISNNRGSHLTKHLKIMAKSKIQVRLTTKQDQGIDYTHVSCAKGILGGIYFLEDDDYHFRYSIQMTNGWWYDKTFETELEAVRYLVKNSFLMNWNYDVISIKLGFYSNSERGAITFRDNIQNINLAA